MILTLWGKDRWQDFFNCMNDYFLPCKTRAINSFLEDFLIDKVYLTAALEEVICSCNADWTYDPEESVKLPLAQLPPVWCNACLFSAKCFFPPTEIYFLKAQFTTQTKLAPCVAMQQVTTWHMLYPARRVVQPPALSQGKRIFVPLFQHHGSLPGLIVHMPAIS